MIKLKSFFYKTDQGPYLELNQDGIYCDFAQQLFLVVDAFGGQGIGDQLGLYIKDNFPLYYSHLTLDPESTVPFLYGPQFFIESNALLNAAQRVHSEFFEENEKRPPRLRGGASLTALSLSPHHLHLCSIGSNRTYLFRNNQAHSLDLPEISLEKIGPGLCRNALGLFESAPFALRDLKLHDGDKILTLTDGIHQLLSEVEIQLLLKGPLDHEQLMDELIGIAKLRGGRDNVSGIILSFSS